jgi:hypothetical protein
LLLVSMVLVNFAWGQKTWKLISEKDDIYVYTQNLENSKFKAVRAVCTVDCGITKLSYVLMDVSNTKDWVMSPKFASC